MVGKINHPTLVKGKRHGHGPVEACYGVLGDQFSVHWMLFLEVKGVSFGQPLINKQEYL